ncbi:hypothetical protein KY46_08175 [Photobacterium halotolerans]|uniref:Uncharacterized protein n=1 Tax=Photobacterium halotolerans TaxID=265726 RepID=A0A0F5VEL0_9GAMM|nr:hypothetical protein KY46_08175 [Photobacterium halotolerans]
MPFHWKNLPEQENSAFRLLQSPFLFFRLDMPCPYISAVSVIKLGAIQSLMINQPESNNPS